MLQRMKTHVNSYRQHVLIIVLFVFLLIYLNICFISENIREIFKTKIFVFFYTLSTVNTLPVLKWYTFLVGLSTLKTT